MEAKFKTTTTTSISKELEEYFSIIGRKGGQTLVKRRGSEYMAMIGKKGGRISRRKKGVSVIHKQGA